jgi:hypothetical protein
MKIKKLGDKNSLRHSVYCNHLAAVSSLDKADLAALFFFFFLPSKTV